MAWICICIKTGLPAWRRVFNWRSFHTAALLTHHLQSFQWGKDGRGEAVLTVVAGPSSGCRLHERAQILHRFYTFFICLIDFINCSHVLLCLSSREQWWDEKFDCNLFLLDNLFKQHGTRNCSADRIVGTADLKTNKRSSQCCCPTEAVNHSSTFVQETKRKSVHGTAFTG